MFKTIPALDPSGKLGKSFLTTSEVRYLKEGKWSHYKVRKFKLTIIVSRTGRVAFDAMGDRLFAEYRVINIQRDQETQEAKHVQVGNYSYINVSDIDFEHTGWPKNSSVWKAMSNQSLLGINSFNCGSIFKIKILCLELKFSEISKIRKLTDTYPFKD